MQLLKQTAGRLFRASAAVLTFGVLLAMVACDDDSQQPTSIDSATLDANTSDAAILDGASHDQNSVDVTDTMVTTAISGFAATGVALPLDSPVEANCVAGKQAAKTALGVAFTLPAAGLTFPCVLRAVYGTGEQQKTLYSVASAAGTAHITPLTHAVVTKAAAGGSRNRVCDDHTSARGWPRSEVAKLANSTAEVARTTRFNRPGCRSSG